MHARDHENVRDSTVETHPRGAEVLVPLLKNYACLFKPGFGQRRPDRTHAGRRNPHIGENERQDPRAVVEGARDHRRQIVFFRETAHAQTHVGHFTRCEQFIPTRTSWKLHKNSLLADVS